MKRYIKEGQILCQFKDTDIYEGTITTTDGSTICNPTEKQLQNNGFELYVIPPAEPVAPPTEEEIAAQEKEYYEQRVDTKIRERYSMSNELAILRQRDTKPQEFEEYNKYCEDCKAAVKAEIAAEQQEQTIL